MFTAENNASIDTQAFKGCAGLNAIYLPDDAVAIPKNCTDDAFQNCPTNGTIYYSGSESGLANDFKAKFGGLNG
jgi:hypothetical protein